MTAQNLTLAERGQKMAKNATKAFGKTYRADQLHLSFALETGPKGELTEHWVARLADVTTGSRFTTQAAALQDLERMILAMMD